VKAANQGLQTTSFRIGQIAGGYANGAWATTDWLPIMLASAVSLGSLPDAIGFASWTPTDVISQAILDVAFTSGSSTERALNLVHPHPVLWSTIMENFADVFVEDGITSHRLPLVPVEDWVAQLTELSTSADANTFERIVSLLANCVSWYTEPSPACSQASQFLRGHGTCRCCCAVPGRYDCRGGRTYASGDR
jgi:thioester reductase-like protein